MPPMWTLKKMIKALRNKTITKENNSIFNKNKSQEVACFDDPRNCHDFASHSERYKYAYTLVMYHSFKFRIVFVLFLKITLRAQGAARWSTSPV